MKKKEFNKLMEEATKEFEADKKERVKEMIKDRLKEYEMAKATVAKLEKQFDQIRELGYKETTFLE